MKTHETSGSDDAARADKSASLGVVDELACIRARARLLELALLGGGRGMSLEDGTYHDALIQGAQDIAEGLDSTGEKAWRVTPALPRGELRRVARIRKSAARKEDDKMTDQTATAPDALG